MIQRRFISFVLIFNILIGLLGIQNTYADNTGVQKIYRLDTGVIFIWANSSGAWQKGYSPGSNYPSGFKMDLTYGGQYQKDKIKNVKAYPYTAAFYRDTGVQPAYNVTAKAGSIEEYNEVYMPHASQNINITKSTYDPKVGEIDIKYNAKLSSNNLYDVKQRVAFGREEDIYDYMGGKSSVPADVIKSLEAMKGNLFSPKVQGYMYFVPIIIEYEVEGAAAVFPDLAVTDIQGRYDPSAKKMKVDVNTRNMNMAVNGTKLVVNWEDSKGSKGSKTFENLNYEIDQERNFTIDLDAGDDVKFFLISAEINPEPRTIDENGVYANNLMEKRIDVTNGNVNLKIKFTDIPENGVEGDAMEATALVELEGASFIASDITFYVGDVEVQRFSDMAIAEPRAVTFNFKMPNKAVNIYAAVNRERNKPTEEVRWEDNVTDLVAVALEPTPVNPGGSKIDVSISAPSVINPKAPYGDWTFKITVTWRDLWYWQKHTKRKTNSDGSTSKKTWYTKEPIYETYNLSTDAYGQMMTNYKPNTGEQTFEKTHKAYPAKSKTVSFDGSESYTFSVPGKWLVVDTKSIYGFGVDGYNAKLEAKLSNGAKDTKNVFVKGIPVGKTGVGLEQ
jgi:hypothetical protein